MTDFITQTNITKPKLSKAERKAIHDAKEKAKIDAKIEAMKKHMFEFTDEQKATGDFTKSFFDYHYYDHETLKPNTPMKKKKIFEKFPEKFQKTDYPDFFNFTHWIGVDVNDFTYKTDHVLSDGFAIKCSPIFAECSEEEKVEFMRHVNELGERSISKLMVFNVDHPEIMHEVPIKIWRSPTESFDYWFRIQYRPNRIYLTDYDGFKVFDFELNLLFFKSVSELEPDDVYGFKVDPENWNQVRIWSMKKAREITNTEEDKYLDYNTINGVESIAELVIT